MTKRYEIWDAKVRFEDSDEVKERPVLIWNETVCVVMAYKMTGTDRGDSKDEFSVHYWEDAGLTKPTFIRISKLLRLRQVDLIRKRGELDPRDRLRFELRMAG